LILVYRTLDKWLVTTIARLLRLSDANEVAYIGMISKAKGQGSKLGSQQDPLFPMLLEVSIHDFFVILIARLMSSWAHGKNFVTFAPTFAPL
jgi:hypothetical protein